MNRVLNVGIGLALLISSASCQRALSPQQVSLHSWTSSYSSGNAENVQLRDDGTIYLTIEADPGGPEYLWFDLKVAVKSESPVWFQVENAMNAHQTGQRWGITRPFLSVDGRNWKRCTDSRYGREGIAKMGGDPVFRFRAPFVADTLYAAYFVPYTVSDLSDYLGTLPLRDDLIVTSLGMTEEKRNIPLISLPALDNSEDARTIWIIAREHPGESPPSFVCQGMIDALLSGKYNALRQSFSIKIVPILNVDGVEQGNYYHNAKGINLARDWVDFRAIETRNLKRAIEQDSLAGEVALVVNLHASNDPTKGHFFLKIPNRELSLQDAKMQENLFHIAGQAHDQIQGHSPVTLKDIPGIMGRVLYDSYGIYVLYFESNYSLGVDGSDVTVQSLYEVGDALVNTVSTVLSGEQQ